MYGLHEGKWKRAWKSIRKGPQSQALSYLLHSWKLLGVIAITSFVLTRAGLLHQWEMLGLDPLLSRLKEPLNDIVLVQITDEDYQNLFSGRSPLNTLVLHCLISTIAHAQPAVIIVDLDVSESTLPLQFDSQSLVDSGKRPRIVWAQPVRRSSASGDKRPVIDRPLPALARDFIALPLFPRDRDGVVRQYKRWIETGTVAGEGCQRWPTLPTAAHDGNRPEGKRPKDTECEEPNIWDWLKEFAVGDENARFFNMSGDQFVFPRTVDAASVLDSQPSDLKASLMGKSVIFGGTYEAARDEYFTPGGPLPGMTLVAFALASEQSRSIRTVSDAMAIVVDILFGALVVYIGYSFALWFAMPLSFAAAIFLPLLGSLKAFEAWRYLFSFVPITAAAIFHLAIDNAICLRKAEHEIETLKRRFKQVKSQVHRINVAKRIARNLQNESSTKPLD